MGRISHYFGSLILKMLRAFVIWGVVFGGITTAVLSATARALPNEAEWILIGLLAVIAGLLGMVSALAWELTHIPHVIHLVRQQSSKNIDNADRGSHR